MAHKTLEAAISAIKRDQDPRFEEYGTVEKHKFGSKKEKIAFIHGLSIIGWRSYAFTSMVKL
jgi:hypothetical protein